ncbi:MAG: alpha/beta hydrolase, partial [Legionella sp.]
LGAHDQVVNSKKVEQLFSSLPNATIHWLSNSAHVLPLDNDLAQIIQCINAHASSSK